MSASFDLPSVLPGFGKINPDEYDELCFGPELVPGFEGCPDNNKGCKHTDNRCSKCFKLYSKEKVKYAKQAEKDNKERQKQAELEAKEKQKQAELEALKKIKEAGQEQYKILKTEFEEEYLMVCGGYYKIMSDGTFNNISNPKMNNITANKFIESVDDKGKVKNEKFLPIWLADRQRIDYACVKFYPPKYEGEITDDKYYNMWNGFRIEKEMLKQAKLQYDKKVESKYEEWQKLFDTGKITQEQIQEESQEIQDDIKNSFNYDDEKILELIEPILNHIDFITGKQKGFTLKWLARIIQFPGVKTNVALLIRDMGSLFVDAGGIGKNLIIEFFGKMILGSRYFHVVSENRELFEDFNTSFNGKLLVFVEEAGGKENFDHKHDMNSKITKTEISIQGKGDNRFTTGDFCNFIFTTNNEKPLPINKRRFAVFDSLTDKRGDVEYFENLVSKLKSFEVQWAFYLYLKNLNTWDSVIKIQTSIPDTKARRDLIRYSSNIVLKWMADFSTLVFLKTKHTATETYNHFCNWYRNSREGTEATIMKSRDFFNKIKTEDKCFIKNKNSNVYYEADLKYILENLKNEFLLPGDYTMEHAQEEWNQYLESIK